jgi:hypothetical protein
MTLGNDGFGWIRWAISFALSFVLGVGLMSLAGEVLHRVRAVAQLNGAGSAQTVEPVHAERRQG